MSRKLIHSVRALVVSFGLLAVGLIVAVSPPPRTDVPTGVVAAASVAETRTESGVQKRTTKPYSRQRRAQARESMALPFFSFAQGLRRGNGS
jgi:hypothetical protein